MYQRVGSAAYKANLDNTVKLLSHLGNPQNEFRCVHVAGTNGKGSVSNCLASVFQEAGYKTGLYTSPHLVDFRERIRINGAVIEKAYVVRFIEKYRTFLKKLKPSFFEMSVGLCFQYFADRKVDVAIIETGMGGRLDSTNIIVPDLSVITNIGFDHTLFLGDTLPKIASEKAGIIKPGIPIVIGETQNETKKTFLETAKKNKSKIVFADSTIHTETVLHTLIPPMLVFRTEIEESEHIFRSPLAGLYQMKNLKTVLAAALQLREAGFKLYIRHIQNGIARVVANTGFRGRWMVFGSRPAVIMDTGHNADGLTSISIMLKSLSYSTLHMVIGMVDDKDHQSLLKLLPAKARYYLCRPSVPRGFDEQKLLSESKKAGLKAEAFSSVEIAVRNALSNSSANDIIFIGGSTFTVADAIMMKEFSESKKPSKASKEQQIEIKF